MNPIASREVWRIAGIIALALVAGFAVGWPLTSVALALAGYVAVVIHAFVRLDRWIASNPQKAPPELYGIADDIASRVWKVQRRRMDREKRLAKLLKQFDSSTQALPNPAVLLNHQFEIEWLNEASSRLLGLNSGRDTGMRVDNILRYPGFRKLLNKRGEGEALELPSPADSGIMLSLRLVAFGDNQYLLLANDITERLRLDRMRSEFISNASHELRTPLTVIMGYLEKLDDAAPEASVDGWRKPVKSMLRQGRRMRQIVDDLLLLARLEDVRSEVSTEVVHIATMIQEIVDEALTATEDKDQTIHTHLDSHYGLNGNREGLHAVFSNLIQNAVRHGREGARIVVTWEKTATGATFEVCDDGPGIAEDHIPRLTERFFRVDDGRSRSSGGTGLGLAIVKHSLELHGSELKVESRVGEGSRFYCEFSDDIIVTNIVDPVAQGASNVTPFRARR